MEVLNPAIDLDIFFQALKKTKSKVLLLDYDGTLAPFKVARDEAVPYPGVVALLNSIILSPGSRLIIISGRSVKDVQDLLTLRKSPEIWGSHGWERLKADGSYEAFVLEEEMIQGLEEAQNWVKRSDFANRSEFKHGCVALHWRGVDDSEKRLMRGQALAGWSDIARVSGLEIHEFDGGLELRAPGRNKGESVKKVLSETGDAVVSYWGDDITDEDAFRALGSAGLSVLVNENKRPTNADIWITPPEELLYMLERWKRSL